MMRRGLLTPIEHARVSRQVGELAPRQVSVHIPTYTECTAEGCGFDPISRAAIDISCSVCNGTGRTVSWAVSYTLARVVYPRLVTRGYDIITTGIQGDVWLAVPLSELGMFRSAMDLEGAYVSVDGRKATIISVEENAIEQISSAIVACNFTRGSE